MFFVNCVYYTVFDGLFGVHPVVAVEVLHDLLEFLAAVLGKYPGADVLDQPARLGNSNAGAPRCGARPPITCICASHSFRSHRMQRRMSAKPDGCACPIAQTRTNYAHCDNELGRAPSPGPSPAAAGEGNPLPLALWERGWG